MSVELISVLVAVLGQRQLVEVAQQAGLQQARQGGQHAAPADGRGGGEARGGAVAIGATLAGVILTSNRGLRKDMRDDMKQGESRLREDMGKLDSRLRDDTSLLRDDIKQLGERVARVEHSQAKLEGLLEGLREAITVRASAS